MKFVASREDLVQAVTKLQSIVAARPSLPLLANFMIEARENELTLTATDLTVGIRTHVKAEVVEKGSSTLPTRRFCQLIRELTLPNIQMTINEQEIASVQSGNSRFKLHGLSHLEFPQLPPFREENSFVVMQSALKEAFFKTAFAVSKEDSRYVLTGVLMSLEEGVATFVGTDGKRLANASIELHGCKLKGRFILPAKAVEEVTKCLEESDKTVRIYAESDKVAFDLESTLLMTRLVAGEYPDFHRVIPSQVKIDVIIHREELMSLLRQVVLFTGENNQSARFTLNEGELTLSAISQEVGECRVSMPLHYQGSKFDIAFNPAYFLDILRHISDETFTLGLIDPFNPGMISDSKRSVFVLMPMRLSDVAFVDKEQNVEVAT